MRAHRHNPRERGQVIVAALAVLFLLAFVASIYLAVLSRNLGRVQRTSSALQATYLAQAGIKYADNMLTHSAEGADWRPDPQPTPNPQDPDYEYIKDGFSRFSHGNGRFLLRVSYAPVQMGPDGLPVDANGRTTSDQTRMVYPPTGRYIKIESIGRNGVVDPTDPTTWLRKDAQRRMLVAYKPIGITDYVRFVTNKDRSDTAAVLGADLFDLPDGNNGLFRTVWNGPLRVNGDLVWTGLNTIRLNGLDAHGNSLSDYYGMVLNLQPVNREDTVDISGRVFHSALPDDINSDQVLLENPAAADPNDQNVVLQPSLLGSGQENGSFHTAGGSYRDGLFAGTMKGKLRGVTRLEPPKMDEADVATGILRYRLVTRNSGVSPEGANYNLGQYGLGRGIYIDNGSETQRNNAIRRLTDEWASPGTGRESDALGQSYWRQHLYTPPGTEIYLDPTPAPDVNSGFDDEYSQGTIVITRHDGRQWRDEQGRNDGYSRRYRYPLRQVFDNTGRLVDSDRYDRSGGDAYRDRTGAYTTFQNGVIFAEGNLRISGKLPADWVASNGRIVGQHLTIVSNGTVYIEGNLLKGDAVPADTPYGRGVQMSGIAILAKNYICVNTSAHFMRQPDSGPWSFSLGNPFTELGAAGQQFTTAGYSAVSPSRYPTDNGGARQRLLLLQTAESSPGGAADLRVAWHGGRDTFDTGSVFRAGNEDVPMLVSPGFSSASPAENIWQHLGIPIVPSTGTASTSWAAVGRPLEDWYTFIYRPFFGTSPLGDAPGGGTTFTRNYNQPLWLSRVALSPLDVRIEAVLFAQEGCFYVMPGEWLNTNTNDYRAARLEDSPRKVDPTVAGWRFEDNPATSLYPFYGEPADIRVVINGAVAENMPAPKEHQTLWMRHWGYTPRIRPDGSDSPHEGSGLTYLYDHMLRLPVRFDRYNRPLPPMPALPVSPDLVFYGEGA